MEASVAADVDETAPVDEPGVDEQAARIAAEQQAQTEPAEAPETAEQPQAEPAPAATTKGRIVLHSGATREVQDIAPVNQALDDEDEPAILDLVDLSGKDFRVRSSEIAISEPYPA